jgi:hypothetical protein
VGAAESSEARTAAARLNSPAEARSAARRLDA